MRHRQLRRPAGLDRGYLWNFSFLPGWRNFYSCTNYVSETKSQAQEMFPYNGRQTIQPSIMNAQGLTLGNFSTTESIFPMSHNSSTSCATVLPCMEEALPASVLPISPSINECTYSEEPGRTQTGTACYQFIWAAPSTRTESKEGALMIQGRCKDCL